LRCTNIHDDNQTEIYEVDRVRIFDTGVGLDEVNTVVWNLHLNRWVYLDNVNYMVGPSGNITCEVVGNQYDVLN